MSRRHNPVFTQTGSLKESGVHHLDSQMMQLSSQLASNLVAGERMPSSYAATLHSMQPAIQSIDMFKNRLVNVMSGLLRDIMDKCNTSYTLSTQKLHLFIVINTFLSGLNHSYCTNAACTASI